MEFGVHLIGLGRQAVFADLVQAAQAAEELGYQSVWINDHVIIPTHHTSSYPYSADGQPSFTPDDTFYDPFVLLASIAAQTTTIRLGTSVAVIPYRPPVLTAKAITTLDIVSGGRFIFGAGVGWFVEEMELLGVSFKERARSTRAALDEMKALWTQDRPQVTDMHGQLVEVGFAPKPVQKPYPPIWFGGESRPALKRVVEYGDGWFPAFISPEDFATKSAELQQLCTAHSRDFAELTICAFPANRSFFNLEGIRTYRQHGASILLAPIGNPDVNVYIEQMRRFKQEVMEPARTI